MNEENNDLLSNASSAEESTYGTPNETRALTRRQFLKLAAASSAGIVMAACAPAAAPAPSGAATSAPQVATGGGELNFLTWTNFVPEMDTKMDELAKKWGTDNKVNVKVEHININ